MFVQLGQNISEYVDELKQEAVRTFQSDAGPSASCLTLCSSVVNITYQRSYRLVVALRDRRRNGMRRQNPELNLIKELHSLEPTLASFGRGRDLVRPAHQLGGQRVLLSHSSSRSCCHCRTWSTLCCGGRRVSAFTGSSRRAQWLNSWRWCSPQQPGKTTSRPTLAAWQKNRGFEVRLVIPIQRQPPPAHDNVSICTGQIRRASEINHKTHSDSAVPS